MPGNLLLLIVVLVLGSHMPTAWADKKVRKGGPCLLFHLKTDNGEIINPVTGQNADQPFSTRQTCGACHDYDKMSKGFHMTMGWDEVDEARFRNTSTPWKSSPGMAGGF